MKICVVACLTFATICGAFGQGPAASFLNVKQEGAFLLTFDAVQKELKATQEQADKWNAMFQKQAEDEQNLYSKTKLDSSAEEIAANEKAVEALERTVAEQALALATPGQVKRLKEITLQHLDIEAFGNQDVQSELSLSQDQKEKIDKLVKSYLDKQEEYSAQLAKQADRLVDPPGDDSSPVAKTYRDQMDKVVADSKAKDAELGKFRESLKRKAIATLNDQQRTKWAGMLGAPFSMPN